MFQNTYRMSYPLEYTACLSTALHIIALSYYNEENSAHMSLCIQSIYLLNGLAINLTLPLGIQHRQGLTVDFSIFQNFICLQYAPSMDL